MLNATNKLIVDYYSFDVLIITASMFCPETVDLLYIQQRRQNNLDG